MLEEAVHGAPDDPQAREALVHAYIAERDWSAARTAAEELKSLRPDSAEGYYLAGLVAHDEKRLDDSMRKTSNAHSSCGQRTEISLPHSRVSAWSRAEVLLQAIARLVRSLERDSNDVQLLDLLGETYLQSKDLAHATETLKRAAAADPAAWVAPARISRKFGWPPTIRAARSRAIRLH